MRKFAFLAALLFAAACNHHPVEKGRLETTPRHDEWVTVDSAGRPLHLYVVYPQSSKKTGAVLVIHENRGLTDWVRTVADKLAEKGYIAIAPDMLSGAGPNGGRTKDFPSEDAAREAISKLSRPQILSDLTAAAAYARSIPSMNGKLAVGGFCWGGARTWDTAATVDGISAAFVFYGTGPMADEAATGIEAPVYGFYGGDDARVNATIDTTKPIMEKLGKKYEPVIYAGAGHAFMRLGEMPDASEANKKAHDEAWTRWLSLLRVLD
jgi:carboxymethylenebutenolidase